MPAEQATSVSVPADRPQAALSLIDCTSIVVGIIIGSAIYKIAPLIAKGAAGPIIAAAAKSAADGQAEFASDPSRNAVCIAAVMGVWIVGGLVALIGAMCYADRDGAAAAVGGTYVYLSAALGRTVGFAFAWAEFGSFAQEISVRLRSSWRHTPSSFFLRWPAAIAGWALNWPRARC